MRNLLASSSDDRDLYPLTTSLVAAYDVGAQAKKGTRDDLCKWLFDCPQVRKQVSYFPPQMGEGSQR